MAPPPAPRPVAGGCAAPALGLSTGVASLGLPAVPLSPPSVGKMAAVDGCRPPAAHVPPCRALWGLLGCSRTSPAQHVLSRTEEKGRVAAVLLGRPCFGHKAGGGRPRHGGPWGAGGWRWGAEGKVQACGPGAVRLSGTCGGEQGSEGSWRQCWASSLQSPWAGVELTSHSCRQANSSMNSEFPGNPVGCCSKTKAG